MHQKYAVELILNNLLRKICASTAVDLRSSTNESAVRSPVTSPATKSEREALPRLKVPEKLEIEGIDVQLMKSAVSADVHEYMIDSGFVTRDNAGRITDALESGKQEIIPREKAVS